MTSEQPMGVSAEDAALFRRVSLRVAAPLIVLYVVAFLDRVNVSFAALTMNRDLGLDERTFGFAAGIFFLGYMLFAVPSNVAIKRVGPRWWLAFLMVSWGCVSGGLAFVHGARMYALLRFLLGAAEAGFFPGIVFYLTRWLPTRARGGILGLFMFSVPMASIIGSPISAKLLRMNGVGGLHGWQWMFLLESLPAVLLGLLLPLILTPAPEAARWLSAEEKQRLAVVMAEDAGREGPPAEAARVPMPWQRVAAGATIYFLYAIALYALGFWVPKLLASHGVGLVWLGWLTSLPFLAGGVVMIVWSRAADRAGKPLAHFMRAMLVASAGFLLAAWSGSVGWVLLGLVVAAMGVFPALPLWWAAFSARVPAARAAVAIALVNSVGNLGGFAGPPVIGWLTERTHAYTAALALTAVCCAVGVMLARALDRA